MAIIFVDSSSNGSSSQTEVVPVPDWLTPFTLTGAVAPTIAEAEVDATATEETLYAIKNYFYIHLVFSIIFFVISVYS